MTRATIVTLIFCCGAFNACTENASFPDSEESQRNEQVAKQAFLAETDSAIRTYSIRLVQKDRKQMTFFIEGTGEFRVPGYHWTVIVDRKTGKTEVHKGQ